VASTWLNGKALWGEVLSRVGETPVERTTRPESQTGPGGVPFKENMSVIQEIKAENELALAYAG
jgi:hypothetical protein